MGRKRIKDKEKVGEGGREREGAGREGGRWWERGVRGILIERGRVMDRGRERRAKGKG